MSTKHCCPSTLVLHNFVKEMASLNSALELGAGQKYELGISPVLSLNINLLFN